MFAISAADIVGAGSAGVRTCSAVGRRVKTSVVRYYGRGVSAWFE